VCRKHYFIEFVSNFMDYHFDFELKKIRFVFDDGRQFVVFEMEMNAFIPCVITLHLWGIV